MVKKEGLNILEEKVGALDVEKNKAYKFLGCVQAKKIDIEKVGKRVRKETEKQIV